MSELHYSVSNCMRPMLVAIKVCSMNSSLRMLLAIVAIAVSTMSSTAAQEVEIWEYSPYKVGVWLSLDPSIDKSALAQEQLIEDLKEELARTFGAAWKTEFMPVPANMQAWVERDIPGMVVDHFSNDDLVMLIDKSNEALKTLRVFDTALEKLDKVGMTETDHHQMLLDTEAFADNELTKLLRGKASELVPDYLELVKALQEKRVTAVMVPRMHLSMFATVARSLATTLPWHTERYLREHEKLFLAHARLENEEYKIVVRELDCPMRLFGPAVTASTPVWSSFSKVIGGQFIKAFAPVARIEEANGRLVNMLNRAGGLADPENPVIIKAGEVLQPVIRRDEKRGAAPMLEPIPWTYIGVTKSSGIQLEGTCYSAMGNVLQGKQTRRAQRVALRVRPLGEHSDVKVVVRTSPNETQPGCQIYQKNLLTDDLTFVGHTDWRGIITIERSADLGLLLPERVKIEQQAARRAAQEASDKAAMESEAAKRAAVQASSKQTDKPAETKPAEQKPQGEEDSRGPSAAPAPEARIAESTGTPAASLPGAQEPLKISVPDAIDPSLGVPLVQPLVLLYVKSGDTVLARLPLVPGLNEVDLADLPSDSRRLEAEAHFKGFQGEILDLIAKRAILNSRVAGLLKEGKIADAEALVPEADLMRGYKEMSDELNAIHARMIDDSRDPLPLNAKTRIDRMMITSRDMLQKYLDADLGRKLRADIEAAKSK